MVALRLTARDRETLGHAARHAPDAREARRPLALLDLDAGESPTRVAERYRVSRSTVDEWAARWQDADRPRADRLRDADRSGRPPATREAVESVLAALMPTAPTDHGYRPAGAASGDWGVTGRHRETGTPLRTRGHLRISRRWRPWPRGLPRRGSRQRGRVSVALNPG